MVLGYSGSQRVFGSRYGAFPKLAVAARSKGSPDILVYHNPVGDYLTVECALDANAVLINSIGQIAMQASLSTGKRVLDMNALPPGVYFMQIVDAKGAGGSLILHKQ